jgi:hypothetical protein
MDKKRAEKVKTVPKEKFMKIVDESIEDDIELLKRLAKK